MVGSSIHAARNPASNPSDANGGSPLVSLIMPVWRPRLDWLTQAIRSALAQRDCDFELIVIDDGCPTPVAGLLAELDDNRLRVLRVSHGGPNRARNAAMSVASGKCVRFMDSDDVFHPDSTARLAQLMGGDEDVITYGATQFCDPELQPLWKMTSRLQGSVVRECLLSRFQVRLTSMLFPRRVLEAAGDWDPAFKVSGDWDFVLRTLEHGRVRGDGRIATYYRRHSASTTADVRAGQEAARRVVVRYFDRHPSARGTFLERQAEAMLHARAARIHAMHGKPIKSLAGLWNAFRIDPRAAWAESAQAMAAVSDRLRASLP